MLPQPFPILEFDSAANAIIEPRRANPRNEKMPERCVFTFFKEVINELAASGRAHQIAQLNWEVGSNPVYEIEQEGQRLAVVHPGVGAPLAAGYLEEMIAFGCQKFIACGGCGVLDKNLAVGHLLVPTAAVRDEGTSYHYMPPSREVTASPAALAAVEAVLKRNNVDYLLTKTWTVDAPYRETHAKAALRLSEGCLAVDMEAAAFFAVAQFRGVEFGQILYSGDAVLSDGWKKRAWASRTEIRRSLFWLAVEAVVSL